MELATLHKRVIGLDVHQKQVTACALIEEADGTVRIERRSSVRSNGIAGSWRRG
jgi:hypothetical protein